MEEDAHNPASEHQSSGVYASPMQRQRNAKQDKGEGRSQKGQSQLRERPCQQNNDGGVDAPQGTPLLPPLPQRAKEQHEQKGGKEDGDGGGERPEQARFQIATGKKVSCPSRHSLLAKFVG
jgi:hypothetical protein